MKELPLPTNIPDDAEEFARLIRHPDGRTILVLAVNGNEDPFLWGMHAVDLLHHAARVYDTHFEVQLTNKDGTVETASLAHILQRIREGFDAEWAERTDVAREYVEGLLS